MSSNKSEKFKEYLSNAATSVKSARIWQIAKSGINLRRYGSKHNWRNSAFGSKFKGSKK